MQWNTVVWSCADTSEGREGRGPTQRKRNLPRMNYREIRAALANLKEFKGNSMSARWADGAYLVRSYSTVIATYDPETECRWVSDDHYSVTTSRHQNLCRTWLPGRTVKVAA